jgi:hypothetical protein
MTNLDLAELSRLNSSATPGPWCVSRFDDEHFMSAISIEAYVTDNNGVEANEVIAATLIQQPAYVVPSDSRYCDNAALIAALRNGLPELLRLAELGLAADST